MNGENLPYTNLTVIPFTAITSEWGNGIGDDILALAAGTGFDDNSIESKSIKYSNFSLLGSVVRTSNFTVANTNLTAVTDMTLSVTIPSNVSKVRLRCSWYAVDTNNAAGIAFLSIWDGTVGSGTQVARSVYRCVAANSGSFITTESIVTPSPGAKTYNVGFQVSAPATGGGLYATSTQPAIFTVELI